MSKELSDTKAIECMIYLQNYCKVSCSECALNKQYVCPCTRGERCPRMWEVSYLREE